MKPKFKVGEKVCLLHTLQVLANARLLDNPKSKAPKLEVRTEPDECGFVVVRESIAKHEYGFAAKHHQDELMKYPDPYPPTNLPLIDYRRGTDIIYDIELAEPAPVTVEEVVAQALLPALRKSVILVFAKVPILVMPGDDPKELYKQWKRNKRTGPLRPLQPEDVDSKCVFSVLDLPLRKKTRVEDKLAWILSHRTNPRPFEVYIQHTETPLKLRLGDNIAGKLEQWEDDVKNAKWRAF